jgi:hypothetical protein
MTAHLGLVLALLVAACATHSTPAEPPRNVAPVSAVAEAPPEPPAPAPGTPEHAVYQIEQFTQRMCACPAGDTACADKVQTDVTRWGTEMAKTAAHDQLPSEQLVRQMQVATEHYATCMVAAMTPPAQAP